MFDLQNSFIETEPQLLGSVKFFRISCEALAAALGHLYNDIYTDPEATTNSTPTLPITPFSLMNLIKKLIFSLRLVSCTVRSLFGRMTAESTLCESPLNKALGQDTLTRFQNRTTQKRCAGHETLFVDFRGKAKMQRVLRKCQRIVIPTASPNKDELLDTSHKEWPGS